MKIKKNKKPSNFFQKLKNWIAKIKMSKETSRAFFISLFMALTIGFFAPSHIFLTNQIEFSFLYREIVFSLLLITLMFFIFIFLVLFLFQKIKYKSIGNRLIALVFAIGVLLWFQGNFLVRNIGVFDGTKLDWNKLQEFMGIDRFIWCSFIFLFIIFEHKLRKKITMVCIFLLSLQFLYFIQTAITYHTNLSYKRYEIDQSQKFVFSNKKNIIVLLLDSTQTDVFSQVLKEDSNYLEMLRGFKYYPDTLGGYPTTYPSVPLIFTGKYYKNEKPIQEFIEKSYLNNSLLSELKNNNIRTEVYSTGPKIYFDKSIIDNIRPKRTNIFALDNIKYFLQIYDTVFFRFLPTELKRSWIDNKNIRQYFKSPIGSNDDSMIEPNLDFINSFKNKAIVQINNPIFKYFHLNGSHPPFIMNKDLSYKKGPENGQIEDYKEQVRAMMTIIKIFLDKLKQINAFDNSIIVILADHGVGDVIHQSNTDYTDLYINQVFNDVKGKALSLLLIKPENSKEDFEIKNTQATLGDVAKTVLGMLNIKNTMPGIDLSTNILNKSRIRKYYYYDWEHLFWKENYLPMMTEYRIYGNSWNTISWKNTFNSYYSGKKAETSYKAYTLGEKINFGLEGNSLNFQLGGWSHPEQGYTWTDSQTATLVFPANYNTNLILEASIRMAFNQQRVFIYVNEKKVGEWDVKKQGLYKVTIPKSYLNKDLMYVSFLLPDAIYSPNEINNNNLDTRKLGLLFESVILRKSTK